METNYVVLLLVGLVLSGLSLIGLFYLVRNLLLKEQGYPNEKEIEDALKPFAVAAIQGAYKVSESILEQFEQTLSGADKKKIADNTYAMLPTKVTIKGKEYDITVIKKVITKERWSALVQDTFDRSISWIDTFQNKLVSESLKLIEKANE